MVRPAAEDVVRSLEMNMAAYWLSYGNAPGCRSGDVDGIRWFTTGIQHPLFNSVPLAVCVAEDAGAAVDETLDALRAAKAPSMWWLGPSASPADIRDRLERRGFRRTGATPGMAAELNDIDTDRVLPDGFRIEISGSREARRLWASVAALGTGFTPAITEQLIDLESWLSDQESGDQARFTGFESDVPVATSALVLDSGVAGVYVVATLPNARRKGYGTLLTLAALDEAKRRGYEVAILQASSMGRPLYEKMGFRQVCQFDIYS